MKKLFIYGAGVYGETVYLNCLNRDYEMCFIDKNENLQRNGIYGVKCISFEEYINKHKSKKHILVLAVSNFYYAEVCREFEKVGLLINKDYIYYEDFLKLVHKENYEKLLNKKFTIISNNCWGGWVYREFAVPYQTPTIGLFFLASVFEMKYISLFI